ncbi:sugar phosphate isomerase/epimerase family protein [Lutimonas halocynthiae]|uniref:sugar phosphate isomerase/epimerase family protein n=1 Tax=Lutimonas halocynthiae TaxID=1446477 RepID=UPI0025B551FE|nr:sugar phosphate isomerase/epimerase family protein [Lutimonas halocynthiae]MDN3643942.1 sugar phosphate isomerase/epimerase family protein [Lutimonas halocynthiae]
MHYSRRTFVQKATLASTSLPLLPLTSMSPLFEEHNDTLDVSIFSKHLQFLDVKEVGQVAAELGFNGIDLTVRPKGHILPEDVISNLAPAIRDIERSGSSCKMITTAIDNANKTEDVDIIKTAGDLGVNFYRMNWFKYHEGMSMVASLNLYQETIQNLVKLNKEHGITGCYQNHAGTKVGGSFWEIQKMLEGIDPDYLGVQYDIRHAVAEGGFSWENGLQLLHQKIKTLVLKDFKWAKVNGVWEAVNVPIGEGMVNFTKYFQLLKAYNLNPPVSLHLEYPLGGAEKGKFSISVDKKIVFDAMKKDLSSIRELWAKA